MMTTHRQNQEIFPRLLSVEDVADLLDVSTVTVRRLKDARAIPFCKIGGSLRFLMADIEEYVKRCRVKSINEYEYGGKTKVK